MVRGHLIASVRLGGAYKGQVHLRGRPVFNLEKTRSSWRSLTLTSRHAMYSIVQPDGYSKEISGPPGGTTAVPLENNLNMVKEEINAQLNNVKAGPWIRLSAPRFTFVNGRHRPDAGRHGLNILLSGRVEVHLTAFK